MSFITENRSVLKALFEVLGKAEQWTEDTDQLVEHMLGPWLGKEHGPGKDKEEYSPAQIAAARPLLGELGLTARVDPPRAAYDEVVVLGAAGIGLHRRMELVRSGGVRAEGLTVLAGQRPHSGLSRDGGMDELLAGGGRFGPTGGWEASGDLAYRASLLREKPGYDPLLAAQVLMPSETDLAEFLMFKQWPHARLQQVVLPDRPQELTNELGQRTFVMKIYSAKEPIPLLRVLNGAPADRGHRGHRPTTHSTLLEWLELVAGEKAGGLKVLAVVNQPHFARVSLELKHLLLSLGRGDIDLDLAGCETLPDAGIHLLLGEIPARISAETRFGVSG